MINAATSQGQPSGSTSWTGPSSFVSSPPSTSLSTLYPTNDSSNQHNTSSRWKQQHQQHQSPGRQNLPMVSSSVRRISPSPTKDRTNFLTRFDPVVESHPPSKKSQFHRTSGGIAIPGGVRSSNSVGSTRSVVHSPARASSGHINSHYHHNTTHNNSRSSNDYGSQESLDSWRKYGKQLRANLILVDDANGGNAFTLSEACSIERYYRVADRVLEQFLTGSISEREDLIERYLIGNRLFKFLSIVLPTHTDYFSAEPNLAALRVKSQNQLIDLLQCMEELELMIDEMEYNAYILTDLTPGQRDYHNFSGSDETSTTVQNTSQSSFEAEGNCWAPRNEILAENAETRNSFSPEDFGGESSHDRQSYHSRRSFRSETSDAFAQRVAAVVAANNNNENDTSVSLIKRSISSATDANVFFRKHTLKHNDKSSEFSVADRPSPIFPKKELVRKKKSHYPHHGFMEDSSWGNSISGDFSDPFVTFERSSNRNIDLLMGEELEIDPKKWKNPGQSQASHQTSSSLPKLKKKPPSAYPSTLRAKLQSEAPLNKAFEDNRSFYAPSDFSSDVFCAFEDSSGIGGVSSQGPQQIVFKSKIEERLERAAERQQQEALYDLSNYDDSSMVDFRPYGNRRLMYQCRGCIRSLLD
ncbi:hypothetical protein IV203_004066 [Nitzschia inconspicua]|uniref:Uncharacterized protein n=1 Tax=Nitzschia inconspicua TaxID=303405 RepID=A0A9K3L2Y7_9STRA|nr:hypothetical protein IV203_004066 [Nitzschia inconspicua]